MSKHRMRWASPKRTLGWREMVVEILTDVGEVSLLAVSCGLVIKLMFAG